VDTKLERTKHMKNDIPKTHPELLILAGKAAHGAFLFGAAIPLLQNTQPHIKADTQPLADAIMAHGTGRNQLKINRETLKKTVRDCRTLLMLGRDTMKPVFGHFFNEAWLPLGHDGSLEVSEDVAQLSLLLNGYKEWLVANPSYEWSLKNFTAANLELLSTQLKTAVGAIGSQEAANGTLLEDRDVKAEKLRRRLRGLADELYQTIDPLDQRWKAFGFNMPGAQETPDAVGAVSAVLIGATAVALKWAAVPRADYYDVFKRVIGVDTDLMLVGSPADLDFTLENLPANANVEIVVAAVNTGGEAPTLSRPRSRLTREKVKTRDGWSNPAVTSKELGALPELSHMLCHGQQSAPKCLTRNHAANRRRKRKTPIFIVVLPEIQPPLLLAPLLLNRSRAPVAPLKGNQILWQKF
jgi:hypothetical protein